MSDLLQRADQIAGTDRSRDYGHPRVNHQRIADMWNVYLKDRMKELLTPYDITMLMILLKVAREMNGHKEDTLIDIAGYAKCAHMIKLADTANRNGMNGPPPEEPPTIIDSGKYGE